MRVYYIIFFKFDIYEFLSYLNYKEEQSKIRGKGKKTIEGKHDQID